MYYNFMLINCAYCRLYVILCCDLQVKYCCQPTSTTDCLQYTVSK